MPQFVSKHMPGIISMHLTIRKLYLLGNGRFRLMKRKKLITTKHRMEIQKRNGEVTHWHSSITRAQADLWLLVVCTVDTKPLNCQWLTLLGVAGSVAAVAAGGPLGWGTTGAPSAPWWEDRLASLTSPDREEDRLSRDAWQQRTVYVSASERQNRQVGSEEVNETTAQYVKVKTKSRWQNQCFLQCEGFDFSCRLNNNLSPDQPFHLNPWCYSTTRALDMYHEELPSSHQFINQWPNVSPHFPMMQQVK